MTTSDEHRLATLYVVWHRPDKALKLFNAGLEVRRVHALGVLAGLSPERQLGFLRQLWPNVPIYLGLVFRNRSLPGSVASGAVCLARWKVLAAEVQTQQYRLLRAADDAETKMLIAQLQSARRELARWTLSPPEKMKLEDIRQRREEKEAEVAKLEDALAKKSMEFAELRRIGNTDLKEIARALPVGSVLLDFARFREFNFKAKGKEKKWGDYRYIAFITPAGETPEPILVDLGPAKPIDEAVARFRSAIGMGGKGADAEKESIEALKALSQLVLPPILPHVKDRSHWIVCPDGPLALVPFECLLTDDGKYLTEQVQISYLGAGREAVRYGGASPQVQKRPALLVGDPDYDLTPEAHLAEWKRMKKQISGKPATTTGTDREQAPELAALRGARASRDLADARFRRLPGTRAEVENAVKMIGGTALLDRQAIEEAVKRASKPSVLYLATHGFFLPDLEIPRDDSPFGRGLSGIVGDLADHAPPVRMRGKLESPLLRCGLALAGANQRESIPKGSGMDDGILTGMEAAGLDLWGTKLVVLSACETGVGDINQGEGVIGLRRAFLLAGARRVLATLWKVPDRPTQMLMTDFITRWQAGTPACQALREAQLWLMTQETEIVDAEASIREGRRVVRKQKLDHPYYWAPFVLVGDWK